MENSKNVILEKKTEGFNREIENNFAIENELTVEITLNEYRKLVAENAKKVVDVDKEHSKWLEEYNKRIKLEEKNKELTQKLNLYVKKYGLIEEEETEEAEEQ